MERWFYDISSEDETPILMGQPVFVDYALAERFQSSLLPSGKWFFFDTSNKLLDPGREDLGTRVILIYEDSNE